MPCRAAALLILGLLALTGLNVAEAGDDVVSGKVEKQAALAGLQEVKRTAAAAASSVVTRVQQLLKQQHDEVLKARQDDLKTVQQAVKAEEDWESEAVARMRQAMKEAVDLSMRNVVSTADAWARSNVQAELYNATRQYLDGTMQEEVRAEALREDALAMSAGAATAATKLVQIGREAKELSESLSEAHAEGLAKAVDQDDAVWLSKASTARQLMQLSAEALTKASKLADVALSQAKQAEAIAAKALREALTNADRLKEMERRAVNAAAAASTAATGSP